MESANNQIIMEPRVVSPFAIDDKHDKAVSSLAKDDPNMDPKKLKRILASRQYSQKYRMKQLNYILHLETEVKARQAEVAITSPRLKYVDRQNLLLRVENHSLKQRLSAYSSELMFKEAQYEELQKERDVLKHFYLVNNQLPPQSFKEPTTPAPSPNNTNDPPNF